MASPPVLAFDAEGRPVKFETWLDDLHLFLQLTAKEDISLYDHALGHATAPAATADSTARSQWQTRDAHARFAIRNSLPIDEREHFGQHKTAQALYTAVVARYSSPARRKSSLPALPDPESDSLRAASPTVPRLLATVVTGPSLESTAASALVAELVDYAARSRLDYAASLVAESESVCPPSIGGECALGTDVLEDRQEEFQCLAAASPHLVSVLLTPEGDPDALKIPTPRSYTDAIEGPYSSQWQAAMDAEMASWKSTGTYVDAVPPPGANIVSGMWIFRVKRPRVLRLSSRRVTWLVASSLRWPVYGLRQAPREWHDTLRTTLVALGFAPSTADPSLFLRTDTSLLPFYILVYVDDLVFATADTAGLAHVKSELQKRHTCTDLGELRSYLGLQITRDRARRTITLT
ncbi:unnamed protein product [Closterium sp. NIES-54]